MYTELSMNNVIQSKICPFHQMCPNINGLRGIFLVLLQEGDHGRSRPPAPSLEKPVYEMKTYLNVRNVHVRNATNYFIYVILFKRMSASLTEITHSGAGLFSNNFACYWPFEWNWIECQTDFQNCFQNHSHDNLKPKQCSLICTIYTLFYYCKMLSTLSGTFH